MLVTDVTSINFFSKKDPPYSCLPETDPQVGLSLPVSLAHCPGTARRARGWRTPALLPVRGLQGHRSSLKSSV